MRQVHKVGPRHYILADYRDGRYTASLTDRLQRGSGCSEIYGSLEYVAGSTRRFWTRKAAEVELGRNA